MLGLIQALGRQLELVVRALTAAAGTLLVLMLLLINIEIVGRYFFRFSTLIADEYSAYLFVWMVLLGAAHTLRSDEYLKVTTLVNRLPPRAQNRLGIGGATLGLAVSAVALYATGALVYTSYRFKTLSIQPSATPLVWPQLILPLGFVLLCLAYLEEIVRRIAGTTASNPSEPAARADA